MPLPVFRILFPLAPVCVIAGAVMCSWFESSGSARGLTNPYPSALQPVSMSAKSLSPCCQKIPTRGAMRAKYEVKFSGQNVGVVDYDAGGSMVEITCAFTDLDTERPVVGMSSLGLLRRMQTDTGAVVEGGEGFAVINPGIQSFKDAQFQLRARVPLHTSGVMMLNGALTVLRADERTAVGWHEPFGAEIGVIKKCGGFEISLSKVDVGAEMVEVEWACKPPADATINDEFWLLRKLLPMMTFSDKSSIQAETGTATPYVLRGQFRHNKKVPVAIDLSFISKLTQENLPFTLTDISLEGSGGKNSTNVGNQNF